MSLWHRAPREVYRVYGEDEYLAEEAAPGGDRSAENATHAGGGSPVQGVGADQDVSLIGDPPSFEAPSSPSSPFTLPGAVHAVAPYEFSRSGRLFGLGLLVVVTVGALALVVLNASHRPEATRPGSAATDIARGGRLGIVPSGSVIHRGAPTGQSASANVEVPPNASNGTSSPIVPSRRSKSSLVIKVSSSGSAVHLPSCCESAHSTELGRSRSDLPTSSIAEPSLGDEFGFER